MSRWGEQSLWTLLPKWRPPCGPKTNVSPTVFSCNLYSSLFFSHTTACDTYARVRATYHPIDFPELKKPAGEEKTKLSCPQKRTKEVEDRRSERLAELRDHNRRMVSSLERILGALERMANRQQGRKIIWGFGVVPDGKGDIREDETRGVEEEVQGVEEKRGNPTPSAFSTCGSFLWSFLLNKIIVCCRKLIRVNE